MFGVTDFSNINYKIETDDKVRRQRGRVVKALGLCPTLSRFKTHARHSVVSVGKTLYDTLRHFPLLGGLGKQF